MDKFVIGDQYGENIQFVLPGDRDRYKSLLGAILSLLTFTVLVSYAILRVGQIQNPIEAEIS